MKSTTDPLKDLPRLGEAALAPCAACGTQLLASGIPLFFRLDASRCGIDAKEVQRHVGLAMSMGGGPGGLALAGIMGPGVKPVIVMDKPPTFNVCNRCAATKTLEMILLVAMERMEGEKSDG